MFKSAMRILVAAKSELYAYHSIGIFKHHKNILHFSNLINRCICTSPSFSATSRLTPLEVNTILKNNEVTKEFPAGEHSVRSCDINQLASNHPIEDTRNEGYIPSKEGYLFGVFDGHAGGACAQVLAKRLFHYIAACLISKDQLAAYSRALDNKESKKILDVYGDKFEFVDLLRDLYATSYRHFLSSLQGETKDVGNALEKAFVSLDGDISREALETEANVRLNLKTLSVAMSGAVSTVAYIEGAQLHVASVGDCQAVLGVLDEDQWVPKVIGPQHNAENMAEVHRILQEHPANERDSIIRFDRLFGQLAPLRAFGDVRYKWSREQLQKLVVPQFGASSVPPSYLTPPYLTAKPDVTHHTLTPKDKFLILATDGLWDFLTPLQAVRLVGEHMRGKTVLTPFALLREDMTLEEINEALLVRKDCLSMKPIDTNASTHLIRNALSSTEYGLDQTRLAHLLALPQDISRNFRDDISVTVIYFDAEFLRHSMVSGGK